MGFDIPPGAAQILRTLTAAGYEAYLVGGCVRDLLRGEKAHDWDICTSALPRETEACFSGQRIIETGLRHGTVTILGEDGAYEVTTYRSDGPYSDGRRPDRVRFVPELEEDLARRDFTVNAIAMGLDGELRDPFGGVEDIRKGRLRCVGEPARRFQEDGLRVMRALRFGAVLGYEIEEGTAEAVHACRSMLGHVAAERINVELCKLLVGEEAGRILREYPDVLWEFWPELERLNTLEQNNPWHCWNGWEHTACTVEAAPDSLVIRLTMLLHDVGKPECGTTDEAGVDHFYGHPEAGAALAAAMLRRLKFDNEIRRQVTTLVRYHDVELSPRPRELRRWLNRLGEEMLRRLLEVKRADWAGQAPERLPERLEGLKAVETELERILAQGECFTLKDLAVNGRDVMGEGIPPGPAVGRALAGLMERVLNGELPNEREALLEALKKT